MEILRAISEFLIGHFTLPSERTYWVFLLSAIGLAGLVYMRRGEGRRSLRGFASFLFPKQVWLHKSSLLDYAYFVANGLVMALIFTPLLAVIFPAWQTLLSSGLESSGVPSVTIRPGWAVFAYAVMMILMTDFMLFFSHYLQHKVPLFWQFHKVHHAAEVLNPMTLYRQHPMDFILAGVLVGMGGGTVHALFTHIFSAPFSIWTIGGLNLAVLAFYLFGYNLRHSHIRLSFGKADRWLISPEQHQLHHSYVEAHWDKNMGLILAVWDRLFRTHYIPARDEEIKLGLPNEEHQHFNSIWACWSRPFKTAFTGHRKSLLGLGIGVFGMASLAGAGPAWTPPSVHLDELTWTEVEDAMNRGYTRVIIPTGGTEQNGAHVVLGKHNRIIRHTTEQIAQELGDTLVAPVMDYVPEGAIAPREGHMRYAGTLSVRPEVFEMVLEDTARSLFAHGFDEVLIIGDSGDSVDPQTRITEKLNASLTTGQRVLHVTDYYKSNGQMQFLMDQGYPEDAVGWHAGIRDTSELLAVSPDDVRRDAMRDTRQDQGANGAFWKASDSIGRDMLQLKIDAALRQIRGRETQSYVADASNP